MWITDFLIPPFPTHLFYCSPYSAQPPRSPNILFQRNPRNQRLKISVFSAGWQPPSQSISQLKHGFRFSLVVKPKKRFDPFNSPRRIKSVNGLYYNNTFINRIVNFTIKTTTGNIVFLFGFIIISRIFIHLSRDGHPAATQADNSAFRHNTLCPTFRLHFG